VFEIVKKELNSDVVLLSVAGEFFLENIAAIEETWNETIAQAPKTIGIDCQGISILDSSGIGLMVKMRSSASKEEIELVFIELSETVQVVFETTKLNDFFTTMSQDEFNKKYL
jgi:anti-anti-sigma factor